MTEARAWIENHNGQSYLWWRHECRDAQGKPEILTDYLTNAIWKVDTKTGRITPSIHCKRTGCLFHRFLVVGDQPPGLIEDDQDSEPTSLEAIEVPPMTEEEVESFRRHLDGIEDEEPSA